MLVHICVGSGWIEKWQRIVLIFVSMLRLVVREDGTDSEELVVREDGADC